MLRVAKITDESAYKAKAEILTIHKQGPYAWIQKMYMSTVGRWQHGNECFSGHKQQVMDNTWGQSEGGFDYKFAVLFINIKLKDIKD